MISYNNDKPLDFNQVLKQEKEIYKKQLINENEEALLIDLDIIKKRKIKTFSDRIYNKLQNLFILKNEKYPDIIGRKILSNLYLEGKINALNCSQINSSMILGILIEKKIINNTEIIIRYYPFSSGEKITIFSDISNNDLTNIYYPFNYIDFYTKKEKECSPKGWNFTPERLENLSNGEMHFREYTKNYFKNIIKKGFIIYDPACSTGTFLGYIKNHFPGCKTIGQDLSEEMANYAKNFVDEIYTGDAINSPIPNDYVDIMFLRFLNSEIVTTPKSYELFDILEKKVKKGGYIVLFGHTAVLLKQEYFLEHKNFKILKSSGYNPNNNTIFQYYVIKKE